MSGQQPEEEVDAPASRQRWHAITFLHWRYDPDIVRPLLPAGLDVDTFQGGAWISLTPFVMKSFQVGPLPPLPGTSSFPETNLRTYVRGDDGVDGLWFLSLEAGSVPTVIGASSAYGLPYRFADMEVEEGEVVRYRSRRRGEPEIGHDIVVRVDGPCDAPSDLDHWLTGRWRAYSRIAGRLAAIPVQHDPWALQEAAVVSMEQSLTRAAGLPQPEDEPLVHYSVGVEVRLGVPRLV